MTTKPHRQSISRRSTLTAASRTERSPTWSLDFVNHKFNADSTFGIEILEQGVQRNINQEFLKVDVGKQEENINKMEDALNSSIELLVPIFIYLDKFEDNLKNLSNQMQVLQERLAQLNEEIAKNTKIDKELSPILTDLLLSPECINILLKNPIDKKWIDQMTILQEKKEILNTYELQNENIGEMMQLIEKLEIKCIERIKFHMIDNIKKLRTVKESSVKIQGKLLKVREIISFLQSKNSRLLHELKTAYVYTIRWYYYYNFVKYISSLEEINLHESEVAGNKSEARNQTSITDNSNSINEYLINLPKRFEIMNDENNKYSILAQIAESSGIANAKFFMEQVIQFLNQSIIDNLTIELNFLTEFFYIKDNEEITTLIKAVFSPVLKMGINYSKYILIKCSFDYFGILFTIRRLQSMEYEIQNRLLPAVVDKYLNNQLMLFWPEFQKNIDLLCNNISSTFSSTSVIKAVVSNKNNLMIPLQITQSFGTIMNNFHKLTQNLVFELESSEPLTISMQRLCVVYDKGLEQVSDGLENKRKKLFLYVNFQHVYIVLDSSSGSTAVGTELVQHYKNLAEQYSV